MIIIYNGHQYESIQNMPSPTDEEDDNVDGFFGRRGAGCLFLALNSGNVLIGKRSEKVMEPGTWGTWGGKVDDGEEPLETLSRELREEAGFNKNANYIGVYVFKEGEFRYYNYLVTVPQEFQPTLNEETDDFEWTSIDNLPQPLHFGLEVALPYYKSAIRKVMNAQAQH